MRFGRTQTTVLKAIMVVVLVAALSPSPAAAQSGTNFAPPPTWKARYDTGDGARNHVVMRPGWHIDPGPAAIFWDPGRFAAGNYSLSSTIFMFPAGTGDPPARVDAPYGVMFGGQDLEGAEPGYFTFMVRNDGAFRVARHSAAGGKDIIPWRESAFIASWAEGDQGTAKNDLAVDVTEESVTFWVNDQEVARLPRAEVPAEGVVGLRAGAGLSLHISEVTIGPNRR